MDVARTNHLPSTHDAFMFFAKYRKQVDEKEKNEGKARELQIAEQSYILTQAKQQQQQQQQQQSTQIAYNRPNQYDGVEINSVNFIPVDQTKGTASFRLRTLKSSPKNCSPSLLMQPKSLLPPPTLTARRRITLVIDVDETLVHSTFSPKPGVTYDSELMVNYNQQLYTIYVKFRPYLKDFLKFVAERFEVVIFTASLSAYCNVLMDMLDSEGKLGNLRLFREHCTFRNSSYIKDLFLLGRDLSRIAIIDNSPTAYLFQQRNAIPIKSWFDDPHDEELIKLFTLLGRLVNCESIYDTLDEYNANGLVR